MLEEANDETLALIKKLGSLLYQDEHFEEFKTILGSISPKVVRCSAMVHTKVKNTNKCRFKYKTSLQVDKTNYNGECKGNLLHHAICFGSKRTEYVATLLQHG